MASLIFLIFLEAGGGGGEACWISVLWDTKSIIPYRYTVKCYFIFTEIHVIFGTIFPLNLGLSL